MSQNLFLNNHILQKKQVGVNTYEIGAFSNNKLLFTFKVSLQPTGEDDILPTFQPFPIENSLPIWINEQMKEISDWIIGEQ